MFLSDLAVTERRIKPRLYQAFIVKVRGVDAVGSPFQAYTLTQNLSASGLYPRIGRCVKEGSRLFIVLDWRWADEPGATRIALRGVVVRAEACPHGLCGLALKFTRSRFF